MGEVEVKFKLVERKPQTVAVWVKNGQNEMCVHIGYNDLISAVIELDEQVWKR